MITTKHRSYASIVFIGLSLLCVFSSFCFAAAPPNVDYGIDPNSPPEGAEFIAGGVSLLNGNMVESRTDLSFPSPNRLGFIFQAFYNSRSTVLGDLGYNWSHQYEAKLTKNVAYSGAYYYKITDGSGRDIYFKRTTTGVFPGAFQEKSTLKLEGTVFVWYRLDGSRFRFSNVGMLLEMVDPMGNALTMTYTSSRLISVTDAATGLVLTLNYNSSGLVASISGPVTASVPAGAWVTYGYDARKNLTSVTYADGSGYTYEYATATNHNLTAKKDKAGHVLAQWVYDTSDRCTSCVTSDVRSVTVTYTSATQVSVTDAYQKTRTYTRATPTGADRARVASMSGPTNPPYTSVNALRWGYAAP